MKLRYLHLPRYGPLADLRLVFDQSDFSQGAYALNFVAGVNATGKSSLLRALFEVFRALDGGGWPTFPVDLVYEITIKRQDYTVVIASIHADGKEPGVFFAPCLPALNTAADWDHHIDTLRQGEMPLGGWKRYEIDSGDVKQVLPERIVAYTSGTRDSWFDLQRRVMGREDLPQHQDAPSSYDERPVDWTARRELESAYAEWRETPMTPESAGEWQTILAAAPPSASDRILLATPLDLKLAGLTMCLSETATDYAGHKTESERRDRATEIRKSATGEDENKSARWVLNQAGILWPTHLALTLNPNRRNLPGDTEAKLFALYGLAQHVMALPRGREQVIVSLGNTPTHPLETVLQSVCGEGSTLPSLVQDVVSAIGTPTSNAEALMRLLGERDGADSLYPAFRTLHLWAEHGLLEDVTATFRRIRNDDVVTCESLSDGEQMILGRMGLLFLLKDQHGSLLLLDEPETHFNDKWKREIVDVLHDNLSATSVHALITTHTSIVLSDALQEQVVILEQGADGPRATTMRSASFAAEPGEIMLRVFGAHDSIGQHAQETIKGQLAQRTGTPDDVQRLEALIAGMGPGFYRDELRTLLNKWRADAATD